MAYVCPHTAGNACYEIKKLANNRLCLSVCSLMFWYDVLCRVYHTVVLDDPYDDPPELESHIPDQSPQLTREQLDVSIFFTYCISSLSFWVLLLFYYLTTQCMDVKN